MVPRQEFEFQIPPMPKDLEKLWKRKEIRLPRSVRKYIRRLKNEGRFARAQLIREETVRAKGKYGHPLLLRQRKARRELDRSIYELLATEDPKVEAEQEVRVIWLLELTGEINSDARTKELTKAIDSRAPLLQEYLAERMPEIRNEMSKL